MRVIVAGSRNITDHEITFDAINHAREQEGWDITEIVSGTAKGPDTHGKNWGILHDVPVHEFPADWKGQGKSAGFKRNVRMAAYADALIAIWDGKSKGTKHMITIARNDGLKVIVWKEKA